MKCTCGAPVESVVIERLPVISATHGTLKAVAYCCEKCGTILGVESDPMVRNAEMGKIQKTIEDTKKLQDQIMVKLQARAAGGK